jgi:hypothetical protein
MTFPAFLTQRIEEYKSKLCKLEGDALQKEGKRIFWEFVKISGQYFRTGTTYSQRFTSYGLVSDDVPVYDQEALCGFFVYLCEELRFEYKLDKWTFGGLDYVRAIEIDTQAASWAALCEE